jgi:3-phenylpropionate/cinnamic acid dioxygenase small subunit
MSSDVEAIGALVMAYAARLDAGDLDGVTALFAHATWRSAARPGGLRGSEAVRRAYDVVRLYDGKPCTRHAITNLTVDVLGPDRARANSCFTVFQALPDFPLQAIACGRYEDAFERADGAWCFTDRLIVLDLVGDLSHHLYAR